MEVGAVGEDGTLEIGTVWTIAPVDVRQKTGTKNKFKDLEAEDEDDMPEMTSEMPPPDSLGDDRSQLLCVNKGKEPENPSSQWDQGKGPKNPRDWNPRIQVGESFELFWEQAPKAWQTEWVGTQESLRPICENERRCGSYAS